MFLNYSDVPAQAFDQIETILPLTILSTQHLTNNERHHQLICIRYIAALPTSTKLEIHRNILCRYHRVFPTLDKRIPN